MTDTYESNKRLIVLQVAFLLFEIQFDVSREVTMRFNGKNESDIVNSLQRKSTSAEETSLRAGAARVNEL